MGSGWHLVGFDPGHTYPYSGAGAGVGTEAEVEGLIDAVGFHWDHRTFVSWQEASAEVVYDVFRDWVVVAAEVVVESRVAGAPWPGVVVGTLAET